MYTGYYGLLLVLFIAVYCININKDRQVDRSSFKMLGGWLLVFTFSLVLLGFLYVNTIAQATKTITVLNSLADQGLNIRDEEWILAISGLVAPLVQLSILLVISYCIAFRRTRGYMLIRELLTLTASIYVAMEFLPLIWAANDSYAEVPSRIYAVVIIRFIIASVFFIGWWLYFNNSERVRVYFKKAALRTGDSKSEMVMAQDDAGHQ